MTSDSLRAKGSCCKSGCLHCPYGFTLRKFGLVLKPLDESNQTKAKELFDSKYSKDLLTNSLLDSAFGGSQNKKEFKQTNIRAIFLKDYFCGICEIHEDSVKEIFLLKEFSSQGITQEIVNSFL